MKTLRSLFLLFAKKQFDINLPLFVFKAREYVKIHKSHNKECIMIHKYIYIALSVILVALITSTAILYNQNQSLKAEIVLYKYDLQNLQGQLKLQNEAIEKLKLDSAEYKTKLVNQNKQWQSKYNKITKKLDSTKATCEEQILNINEQLNAFLGEKSNL